MCPMTRLQQTYNALFLDDDISQSHDLEGGRARLDGAARCQALISIATKQKHCCCSFGNITRESSARRRQPKFLLVAWHDADRAKRSSSLPLRTQNGTSRHRPHHPLPLCRRRTHPLSPIRPRPRHDATNNPKHADIRAGAHRI